MAEAEFGQPAQRWLVTGGAGYIGSHVVHELVARGKSVVVLDDLSTGRLERLPDSVELRVGSIGEARRLLGDLAPGEVCGVVHLAGFKNARESVGAPLEYWTNNVAGMLELLAWATERRVGSFIFSSSSSVYGAQADVDAETQPMPQSPYGRTKLTGEWLLRDIAQQAEIHFSCLRYFNVVGCGQFRWAHDEGIDNVLPRFLGAARAGDPIRIYGKQHQTPDGTCQRDYVDVRDLAAAHGLVADAMDSGETVPPVLNVSNGQPISVLEIAEKALVACASTSAITFDKGHPADPAKVWGNPSQELVDLGWRPKYSIDDSIRAHWSSLIEATEVPE